MAVNNKKNVIFTQAR